MKNGIFIGDIVEDNGKTIKSNNQLKIHNIPIGTLVEVKYDEWHGEGCCRKIHARLFVIEQRRDCDGTPLYWLSHINEQVKDYFCEINIPKLFKRQMMDIVGGFDEKDLTVINVTDDIKKGCDSLSWNE